MSSTRAGHIGDTTPFNVAAFPVTSDISQRLNWFGTVRRGTDITGTQGTNVFTLTPVAGSAGSTTTRVGWTIGAGIEGVVSGNWTAKFEYLYVDIGDVSGAFVTPVTGLSGGLLTSRYSSHITDNILRVGLNYRWAAR
jgi:outer membrane immunogenic protein